MLAFEFYINGRKVCVAGLDEPGVVASCLTWVRGGSEEAPARPDHLELRVGGLRSGSQTHVTWCACGVRVGDTVRIGIVDAPKVDRPKQSRVEKPGDRLKRERAYVEKMAASWGWKIRKGKNSPARSTKH